MLLMEFWSIQLQLQCCIHTIQVNLVRLFNSNSGGQLVSSNVTSATATSFQMAKAKVFNPGKMVKEFNYPFVILFVPICHLRKTSEQKQMI